VAPMSPVLRSWLIDLAGSGPRESTDALALARLMAVDGGEFTALLRPLPEEWKQHTPTGLRHAITHIRRGAIGRLCLLFGIRLQGRSWW
jgi:hypothetical protein